MAYDLTGRALYPISQILQQQEFPLAEYIPADALGQVFEGLYYTDVEAYDAADGLHLKLRLAFDGELALSPPGLPNVALVAGAGGGGWTSLLAEFVIGPEPSAALTDVPIALRIESELLKPMKSRTEVDDTKRGVELILGTISLQVSPDGFDADVDVSLSLPLCMVGDTGVLIEATNVRPILGPMDSLPPGVDAAFRGVFIESARVYLPEGLPELAPSDLTIANCSIGTGGFSGALAVNYSPVFDAGTKTFSGPGSGELFGIPFAISRVGITLAQNTFEEGSIAGSMVLPFFEDRLDVEIGLSLNGGFSVGISSPGGLVTLTKEDLLELTLESIGFSVDEGVFTAKISGSIHPLVGDVEWPTFRVQELSIDSLGNVKLAGGWLELREQYVLSLGGFQLEISKIGFGTTEDDRRWIGFSGGLKLVDGITAGASVEGLRVTWDPPTGNVSLTLSGVGVEFEVPGTVYFKGYIAMTEPAPGVTRFDGQITLDITAIGLQIEAQLVVGYDKVNDYAFFAIYIGVELPAGIPLGQTSLGLYGLAGLFALALEPNRRPDPNQVEELPWYGIQPGPSWYHAEPGVGVAELRKWGNREGSLALGGGVTIGTVVDNGYTFAGKFLLGIIFPGPILFIEGRANLLKERASLRDEPLFRTLVVLDARDGTFLMGLDVQFAYDDSGALIEIGGGAEAFFDFNDFSAWHIYVGIDEPRERRIRALIFNNLFEANAYFMIDAHRLKAGAWVGYQANWSFGPLKVLIEAWIEGKSELSFKPPYFTGSLWLHGKLVASVFGFGFGLGADARVSAEVFDPYHIVAELSVSVDLPWPLPDFSKELKLEWGPEPLPPLLPVPLKEISVEHLKVTTTWPLPTASAVARFDPAAPPPVLTLPDADDDGDGFFAGNVPAVPSDTGLGPSDASPVVPLDARPRITFGRTVHDSALVGVNPSLVFPGSAPEAGWEWIGNPSRNEGPARVRSSLSEVALERWDGSRWQAVARKASSPNAPGVRALYGSWAPVPQLPTGNPALNSAGPTANVKLWLWSKSAFDFSRRTGGAWDEYIDRAYPNYPCIDLPKDRQDCIDFSELDEGAVPSAPWHSSAHPEIQVSWRVPPAPIVRVVAGHKELCFPKAAEVEVQLGTRVKEVRVSLDYDGRAESTTCADFREKREGDDANPRQEGKVRFLVLDGAGKPAAQTRILSVPLNAGSLRGLDAGLRTMIDIPPSDFVDLDLTRLDQPPRILATGVGAVSIDEQQALGAPRTLQRIHFERKRGQPKIVRVAVVSPADQVALHRLCYGTRARHVVGEALDRNERKLGRFIDSNGVITVPGREVVAVRLDADDEPFCLTGVCIVVGIDQADRIQREEMLRHMVDELARWQGDDEVLEPWSRYRLKLVTSVEVRDFPYDAAFNTPPPRTITQCAYFRTEGPPGLATYSVPIGHPQANAGAPAETDDPPQFDSGVQDLSRYVEQTVPPTMPTTGEKPSLPRPVYRAYDVGVRFNENYVDAMYRLAGRDLSLALYDNNNQPVRDHLGRLLTTANRWGRADSVALTASEERWIAHVNATTCAQIDVTRISRDVTVGTDAHVLDAGTVYEARLLPLLLHEAFADYTVGAQAHGTGARLTPTRGAGWTVCDEGSDQGPSHWIVREAGNPPARFIEQATNVSNGAALRDAAFAGGTLLIRDDDPRAGVPQADRPTEWTDYRVSCYIRSTDDDLVGVGVRWNGRNGYLFTLDRERDRRRLVRVVDGVGTILGEARGGYDMNRDYLVQIEVVRQQVEVVGQQVDSRIQAFVDGVLVFDVIDNRFASGGVALYCGQNAGGQFRDVRVDDLRGRAPIVYRFKFTTSEFTDFRHHVHSHPGLAFRATLPDLNGVAAALGQAVALDVANQPPANSEARAYDELAVKSLGTDARQTLTRLDVTRIEHAGTAIGLLVRTAEPIDWRRTSAALARAQGQALLPVPANGPRVIRATFADTAALRANDESVAILLDAGADVGGWRVQTRSLPSANAPVDPDGTVLFGANLDVDRQGDALKRARLWRPPLADLAQFTSVNAPGGIGTASWAAGAGVLRQDGNYLVPDMAAAEPARQGTYAVRTGADWRDVRMAARIRLSATGAAGIVCRFQDANNHYRFAFDPTRNVSELTKRVNGVTSALFSQPFALTVGQQSEVVFEALGSRLRITVNRVVIAEVFDGDLTHGSVGFHTWARPLPRFDRVTVESVARTLGPWTIHDHGGIEFASRWQVWQRTFRQDAALFASAPSLAMIDRSGSAAVPGDSGWTDVRIVASFDAALAGAAGLVFRWHDADHHYRLLFDGTTRQSRLVRRSGGASTVLWSAAAPFTSMEVVVEAIGNRLRAWVDDVLLFDVRDDGLSTGRAGVLAIDGAAAIWSAFMVRHVEPKWEDWYQFDAAIGWRAAGRRLRVFAGRSADATVTAGAGEEHLFQAAAPATFRPRLYAPGVDLRLVDGTGQERQLRRCLPEAAYVDQPSTRVLRAADGTGMLVFVPGAGPAGTHLAAGEYRLRLTYRRDNTALHVGSLVLSQAGDTSDETAFIDMPWEVSS